ncbi:tRNA 2'-phosphotransferase 1 [Rhizophlyctis rosea]|uniref:tRNA 2'-phosphotransferase 1 n=1 Tax=Rhizophlyctis rosea TaxID=64517 RepID=A0AAD5WYJ6_9FUNG|nr:tRNA 2'-phosphotransferase 1 [Rhizophlyctis rosea]
MSDTTTSQPKTPSPPPQTFDYLLVLDFEATCDENNPTFPNEIIEFPIVVLSTRTLSTTTEFRTHIRPTINPTLTQFCTSLTGITQDVVDAADPFDIAFPRVVAFLKNLQGKEPDAKFAFVTCGDWDLKTMLPLQLNHSNILASSVSPLFSKWINIKIPCFDYLAGLDGVISNKKKKKGTRLGMAGMLEKLGLPLVGRHHCGIDDARNIAAIAKALVEKGVILDITGSR